MINNKIIKLKKLNLNEKNIYINFAHNINLLQDQNIILKLDHTIAIPFS